ncbi:uncharacterized protein LOC144329031 [Podarcis muralis]
MSAQGNQVNATVSGGTQGNQEESQPFIIPSNPQALAQFFAAFQEFYKQSRPAGQVTPVPGAAAPMTVATVTAAPTAVAPVIAVPVTTVTGPNAPMAFSQDYIPDTQPKEVVLPSTSAPTVAVLTAAKEEAARLKKNTRTQSASSGKSKGGERGGRKGKASAQSSMAANPQKDPGVPSLFQIPPLQAAPAEAASESTSDEAAQGQQTVQANCVPEQATPEVPSRKRKEKRKHTSKKSKKSRRSESEDDSGTSSSSDSDSDAPREEYWGHGEDCVGLPSWAHERRANSYRRTFNGTLEWKDGALVPDVKTSTHLSTDFIVGNHLSQRKRDKILNGDFIDIFRLLPPAKLTGKGEKRRSYGKRRYRTPRAERTFDNWLDGFQVFMGVVSAAYPKRAMHLIAYLAHVRRARELAGDTAALNYDEDFRRNASLLSSTRWDLRDQNYWSEHVGPYVDKKHQDSSKSWKTAVRQKRLCWEFNKGVCVRPVCKYSHECEKCLGNHPATACLKGRQPFRGGRGSYNQGPRGGHGAPFGPQGNRQ